MCSGRDKGKFKTAYRFQTYSFRRWGGLSFKLPWYGPWFRNIIPTEGWTHKHVPSTYSVLEIGGTAMKNTSYPNTPPVRELNSLPCFHALWAAAPPGSTCGFMFSLGICPSYPPCWCGYLLSCLTYCRICMVSGATTGHPLVCWELCRLAFWPPSLSQPAVICSDPVDHPTAPEITSKSGEVSIQASAPCSL